MRSDRTAIGFVLLLLAASAAAFAITQQLKLEETAITDTRVTKVFSPVCECDTAAAHIRFTLRPRDRLTMTIVDRDRRPVRTIVRNRPYAPGIQGFRWNGRRDDGAIAADGTYFARVRLAEARREITLTNRIRVDTTRPAIRPVPPPYRWISPDRDNRHDWLRLRYRVSEPARALLFVDGVRALRNRASQKLSGHLDWFGTKGDARLGPGVYRLALVAEDVAGNRSARTRPLRIEIRFVDIVRRTLRGRPGGQLRVRVRTDVRTLRWRLGTRRGTFRGHVLRVRAPSRPGRYRLVVSTHRHRDRATVVVRRR